MHFNVGAVKICRLMRQLSCVHLSGPSERVQRSQRERLPPCRHLHPTKPVRGGGIHPRGAREAGGGQ